MAYKMKLELSGLKLEIEHDDDGTIPPAVATLQRQLAGVMQTVNALASNGSANGSNQLAGHGQPKAIEAPMVEPRPRGGKGSTRRGSGSRSKAEAIDFKHDAERFGFPKQEWNTACKALWLLYVLAEQGILTEVSGPVLAATFNKHFKTFGTVHAANVHRDLGKEKSKSGWVNSDASQDPQTWYLLEAGKQGVAKTIEEAKA